MNGLEAIQVTRLLEFAYVELVVSELPGEFEVAMTLSIVQEAICEEKCPINWLLGLFVHLVLFKLKLDLH